MLRDSLVELIEPMLCGAGVHCSRAGFSPCCSRHRTIDPQCLENPRPAGAESTLTENARSPFHAEPRQVRPRLGRSHKLGRSRVRFSSVPPYSKALCLARPQVSKTVRLGRASHSMVP